MTEAELIKKSGELTREFINIIRSTTSVPAEQRALALVAIGQLLGSAYATDVAAHGRDRAREWITKLLTGATACARIAGADPDFSFAIIEKNT